MSTLFPLQPGQILDRRYTILEQLGHGGFGRTYLATDSRRHNERCVLKEFVPLMTAQPQAVDKARELFRREAAVLHQLRHPQIPEFREEFEVYDRGQARWILVQQWIEGETYLDLLRSGPFLEVQVIQFLRDFLPILDYLHHHQPPVIHRDIALDNVLLNSATNRPTLIDFGTVKRAMNQVSQATQAPGQSTFVAKRGYSPPEQALGHAYPSSDLYALGVCAIALLTGQRNPAVLYDAHQDQWHWRSYVTSVNPAFAGFLDRLLQSQPRYRYESAAAALVELNVLEALDQADLEPPTRFQRFTRILTRPVGSNQSPNQASNQSSPGSESRARGDRPSTPGLPRALQQVLATSPRQQPWQNETPSPSAPQTQRTVAIGHPSGRAAVAPRSEATEYIWPIWARPLLFAQPLLALLAFRVGPALLAAFLLYGGVRQATRMVTAQFASLPQPSLRRSPTPTRETSQDAAQAPANSEANETPGASSGEAAPQETAQTTEETGSSDNPSPDIAVPEIQLPEIKLPEIKLPEIKLPEIKLPTVELPTIQWPTVELPRFEWPDLEFPTIGLGEQNAVRGCRKKAIARFQKLPPERASWGDVDQRFAAQYPDHPSPLEPENPEHSVYIEDWCGIAHTWLDEAEAK